VILSDAVMDWLESFLINEGLSPGMANEFRAVLLRAVLIRGTGNTKNDPFVDFFVEHQSEMTEWQIHFCSDIAWIMFKIGCIQRDNTDQKLIELQNTLKLIFERSFKLSQANRIALLVFDISKSNSPETEALARRRLSETLLKEKTPGSQLYGTKRIVRMLTELVTVVAQERSESPNPEE